MNINDLEKDLKEIVGARVTTNRFERWFYKSDFMPIPKIIKALYKTMPDAVVKPKAAREVAAILSYCYQNQIPVIPRGGGSSGLFGAVPKKGGIVLDLMDLSAVMEVDKDRKTITAEAGITWWELDKRLRRQGLTLKSYPASAMSATVGGWIMGSGLGIGSLKYGPVFTHLLSAEVVLASGAVKEYTKGQGLEWFFESEGMLCVMTRVCLEVRRVPDSVLHRLLYFDAMKDLFGFLNDLVDTEPRPYNIEIFDSQYLTLIKDAGYEVTDFGPGGGILLVTYDGDREEVEEGGRVIGKLASLHHGEQREGADKEWKQRFNMLRARRAAPTVIPSSVHVPLNKLNQFYSGLGKLNKRPIGLLGYVISSSESVLMPLIVSNEKKAIEYILALHIPRELSQLALSVGGKPGGGLGVWNAPYKKVVLSQKEFTDIKKRKRDLDARGILNPGMWLEPLFLFTPGVYQAAMTVASIVDRIIPAKVTKHEPHGFSGEISACVQCGYCMNYCPTKQQWLSTTPRGRILITKELLSNHSLNHSKITPEYINSIFECTICGRCRVDCSVDIKSTPMWTGLRSDLVKKGFEPESLKALTAGIGQTHNLASKPNDQRANWVKRLNLPYELEKRQGAKIVYFVGCVTAFYPMVQDIARSFARILEAAGVDFTILGGEEWCCGYPLLSAGHKKDAEEFMRHNIERIKEMGVEGVVMTCPGCYQIWKDEYYNISGNKPPFDIFHSTEFIVELIKKKKIAFKGLENSITYHDPCDLGRNCGIFDEPRQIIDEIPGLSFVELPDNREYCNCCGSGGDLLASNQDLSLDIARRKVNEVLDIGAQTVVTACPSCVRAITMAKMADKTPLEVLDITQIVWQAMVK